MNPEARSQEPEASPALTPAQARGAVGGLALLAVLLFGVLLGKRKPTPPPVVDVPPAPPVTPPAAPPIEESPKPEPPAASPVPAVLDAPAQ